MSHYYIMKSQKAWSDVIPTKMAGRRLFPKDRHGKTERQCIDEIATNVKGALSREGLTKIQLVKECAVGHYQSDMDKALVEVGAIFNGSLWVIPGVTP